jgi:hypothetical protein
MKVNLSGINTCSSRIIREEGTDLLPEAEGSSFVGAVTTPHTRSE